MHSSTSSSENGRPVLYAVALLAIIAVVLELVGAVGFGRVSRIQRRTDDEYRAAVQVRPTRDGKPTILLLGNSLLLEGLDLPEFQRDTAADFSASRFVVEQTLYTDWYYGIRKLLDAGARPAVILLGLSIQQLIIDGVRQEYFARFLMDTRDFPDVVRREKLDPTRASGFLFANFSGWVGYKTEIRNWLLVKTLPDVDKMGALLQTPGAPPPDSAHLLDVASRRLLELRQVCESNGTRLVWVIPPSSDPRDPAEAAEQAGKEAGVQVLIPYRPGEMPQQDFRDGFHLNGDGALLFTRRLAAEVTQLRP